MDMGHNDVLHEDWCPQDAHAQGTQILSFEALQMQ